MEFLIFSDSHGKNAGIRQAILRQKTAPDGVFFLGDGLRRLEKELFGGLPLFCVRGNCDWSSGSAQDCPEEQLLSFEGHRILLTHGAAYGVKSGIGRLELAAAEKGADIVLYGHTHCPQLQTVPAGARVGDITLERPMYLFNPGSVGDNGSFGCLLVRPDAVILSHGTAF